MADRCDALLGAFLAARVERISGNVDIRAGGVLVREPSEIAGLKRLFQGNDPLRRGGGILPAKQEGNRLTGSETMGQKVCGGSVHRSTLESR